MTTDPTGLLRTVYLLVFWPTQFRRELDWASASRQASGPGAQARYLLMSLILLLALPSLVTLLVVWMPGVLHERPRVGMVWSGMALGVAFGAMIGAARGRALSVAIGVAVGVALAVVLGPVLGDWLGPAIRDMLGLRPGPPGTADFHLSVSIGVAVGTILGIAGGVADGVSPGLVGGLALGAAYGVVYGIALGVALGTEIGVVVAIALPVVYWSTYFRLLSYPMDLAVAVAAYLVGRRPGAIAGAWHWCPVAWNEVIWLPLPFVARMLVLLAKHDRDRGLRQIAFVAAERPLQRQAAVAALVEVALRDLRARSASELAGVVDRLGWTMDAPVALSSELGVALPRFGRAAEHVAQSMVLRSVYRKGEALDRALAEIEALQHALIAAQGRHAPRLLGVANDWRHLLEAERAALSDRSGLTREIPNPFLFGNPVVETDHNLFTGRRDIVQRLEESLLGAVHGPTLLLHGPRRMGKTSLLNQLPRLLGPDFAPVTVDCQNPAVVGSSSTLLRYVSRAISEGLRRRRVAVEPLAAATLESEPFASFDEWLDGVERAMPAGMRILLCLDEYERLQTALNAGWGAAFLDAMRHTLQHRPRVALMFTGSHTFAELGPEWTDRFISARRVRVGRLTREEVEMLLTRPIPEFDLTYADDSCEAIYESTRGQPFLTQAVAFELVQFLNMHQRKVAKREDVDVAVSRVLVSGFEYFANAWNDAGEDGRSILRSIVRGEPPPDGAAARAFLIDHDVLDGAGEFVIPMVRRWVRDFGR